MKTNETAPSPAVSSTRAAPRRPLTPEEARVAFDRHAAGQTLDETQRRIVRAVYGHHPGGAPKPAPRPDGVAAFASPGHLLLASDLTLTLADGTSSMSTDPLFVVGDQTLSYAQIVTLAADYFAGTTMTSMTQPICTAPPDQQAAVFLDKVQSLLQQSTPVGGVSNPVAALLQGVAAQTAAVQAGVQAFGPDGTYLTYFQPFGAGGESMAEYFDYDVYGATIGLAGYGLISLYNFDHFGEGAQTAYQVGHGQAIQQAIAARTASAPAAALLNAYLTNAFADHYLSDLFSSGHLRVPRQELHGFVPVVGDWWAKDMHDEESLLGLTVSAGNGTTWQAYGDLRDYDAVNADNLGRARAALALSIGEVYAAFVSGQAPASYAGLAAAPDPAATLALPQNQPPMFAFRDGALQARDPISSVDPAVTYEALSVLDVPTIQQELDGYSPERLTWGQPVSIPGARNKYGGPAIVTWNGALWAAWCQHTSSPGADDQIYLSSSSDGVTWTQAALQSPDFGTNDNAPALVVFDGLLYAFWVGVNDEAIYFAFTSDGATWSPQAQLPSSACKYGGPTAAVFDGALYVAWNSHASGPDQDTNVWYTSSTDAVDWAQPTQLPGPGTNENPPTLCVFEDALWVAWAGYHDEAVWFARSTDGVNWSPQQQIPDSETRMGPTLATFDGSLYCAWLDGSSVVNYAVWSGASEEFPGIAGWGPAATFSLVSTDGNPVGLTQFGPKLAVAWEGDGYDAVYVAVATVGLPGAPAAVTRV